MTKKTPEPDDPQQSSRFIELAETIGANETEVGFESKLKAIAQHKPKAGSATNKADPPRTEHGKLPV
jgi:hypothetical protein